MKDEDTMAVKAYYFELEGCLNTTIEYSVCPFCSYINVFVIVDDEVCQEQQCAHVRAIERGEMIFEEEECHT